MCDNILCTKNLHNLYEHNDKLSNDKLMTRFIVDPFDPTLHNFLVVQQFCACYDTCSIVMIKEDSMVSIQMLTLVVTKPRGTVSRTHK